MLTLIIWKYDLPEVNICIMNCICIGKWDIRLITAVSAHEKCFLLRKEVQVQAFCKACNMKESPWNYSKKNPVPTWQHQRIYRSVENVWLTGSTLDKSKVVRTTRPCAKPTSITFLLQIHTNFNHISRMLSRYNSKSVDRHPRSPASFPLLRTIRDCRLWVCKSISCKSGQVYIGQTSLSTETRLKEHHQHICLAHSDNLTPAEHSFIQQYHMQLWDTKILSTKPHYNSEATEIELHPKDRNSDDGPIMSSYAHLLMTPSESTILHKMVEMLVALFQYYNIQVPFFSRHDWTASPMTPKLSSGHLNVTVQPKPFQFNPFPSLQYNSFNCFF